MRAHAEPLVAARTLVHRVPGDGGDVLFAEPFQARQVQPRVRRDTRTPVRVGGAKRLVAATQHDHVARLDLHPRTAGGGVQLLWRHRVSHRDVALRTSGGDVQEHAARHDALVEDGVDRAPGGAVDGQAVGERAPVVQLAVPGHVAQRIDVGDPEAVVDHVEAVQHHVRPLPF